MQKKSTILEMVELKEELGVLIGGLLINMLIWGAVRFGINAIRQKKFAASSDELKKEQPQIYQKLVKLGSEIDRTNAWLRSKNGGKTDDISSNESIQITNQLKTKMTKIKNMAYAINTEIVNKGLEKKYKGLAPKTNNIIDWAEKIIKKCESRIQKSNIINKNK